MSTVTLTPAAAATAARYAQAQAHHEARRPYRAALRAAGITTVQHQALHRLAAQGGSGVVGAAPWADVLPRTAVPLVRAGLLDVVHAWEDTGRPRVVALSAAGWGLVDRVPLPA